MFGLLPLLRGLVMLALAALVLLLAGWGVVLGLRRAGIDLRALGAYRARLAAHRERTRAVEAELGAIAPTDPRFEQVCGSLQALQGAEPKPPAWAFWLR